MSTRDELADELAGWPIGSGYYGTAIGIDDAQALAAALIDSGWRRPRTVTTAEEFASLPVGTIVRDRDGEAWQKNHENGLYLFDTFGPVTVLHEGAGK
jgi:hypothetical protein